MSRRMETLVMGVLGCLMIYLFGSRLLPVHGQAGVEHSYAAVPGQKGGQDTWGPYTIDENWPKDLSTLPGNQNWTWGAAEGIYAESPNRIYLFERGELPVLTRPKNTPIPQFGPSLSFPTNEVPFRNASQGPVASLPGESAGWQGKEGVDAKWEHCLLVVDAQGNIIEDWSQWNSLFKRPHSIYINEYDPTKAVWAVDDARHAIFKFSHDGKELLQTLGTPNVPGADDKHFNRPTFIAWLPDSTMFVSDGYANTRVVKFDKNGKYLMAWGKKGNPPNETRPGYFNTVHGIAADPVTHRIYVNDRTNRRIQVFDENGKFIDMWSTGPYLNTQIEKTSRPGGTGTSTVYSLYMPASRYLWAPDSKTWKILKYDRQGHFLYSWGTLGLFPGGFWGVHQISTDTDGNFYTAEVSYGHFQKFVPRPGANPDFLIGPPVRSAWH